MKTPAKSARRILSVGEVLWDLFETGPRFGGAAANFACHAVAAGAHADVVSAIGRDANGREAAEILALLGVSTALLQEHPQLPTGSVGVSLDASGSPSLTICENVAWDGIEWGEPLASAVAEADAIYFGTLAQRGEISRGAIRRLLSIAKDRGIPRVLDVNLRAPFFDQALIRESIALCSVLKLSDEELPAVAMACGIKATADPRVILTGLLDHYGLACIAMTRGAQGALLVTRDETVDQAGISVVVQDTVGAGDAFAAVLITGLLAAEPLTNIARRACETAASVCMHPGAVSIPVAS
ncbi:carbohydrate kinase [Haloferula sp. BvORR071]|uniref:carbohydrate kinase family protein n=1 Tax=Haloferula sp. BvORR071 TaxID=1396141 RepID=UPI000555FF41|nr:carbohydrate kinase [Haloferula sp. BvORR071]